MRSSLAVVDRDATGGAATIVARCADAVIPLVVAIVRATGLSVASSGRVGREGAEPTVGGTQVRVATARVLGIGEPCLAIGVGVYGRSVPNVPDQVGADRSRVATPCTARSSNEGKAHAQAVTTLNTPRSRRFAPCEVADVGRVLAGSGGVVRGHACDSTNLFCACCKGLVWAISH